MIKKLIFFISAFVVFVFIVCSIDSYGAAENLIPAASADMNDIKSVTATNWQAFGGGEVRLGKSYDGSRCIQLDSPSNTWTSPAIDLYPYITRAGEYTVRLSVRLVMKQSKDTTAVLIRGKSANSFLLQHGGNVFDTFVQEKVESGKWYSFSFSFSPTEEDIKNETGQWQLCLGTVPNGTTTVQIDDLELVYGTELGAAPDFTEFNSKVAVKEDEAEKAEDNTTAKAVTTSNDNKTTGVKTGVSLNIDGATVIDKDAIVLDITDEVEKKEYTEISFGEIFPDSIKDTTKTVIVVTAVLCATAIAIKLIIYKKRRNAK